LKVLLDTHVFLWWEADGGRLPAHLHAAIVSPANEIYVSAVSVWEIAIKRASGKLVFRASAVKAIEKHNFTALPISAESAEWAGSLPQLHRDPFDRLLVAQAQLEGLTLATIDEQILRYQVRHL
jgi:PIN domain nuclease of toxin-antitoxin system